MKTSASKDLRIDCIGWVDTDKENLDDGRTAADEHSYRVCYCLEYMGDSATGIISYSPTPGRTIYGEFRSSSDCWEALLQLSKEPLSNIRQ